MSSINWPVVGTILGSVAALVGGSIVALINRGTKLADVYTGANDKLFLRWQELLQERQEDNDRLVRSNLQLKKSNDKLEKSNDKLQSALETMGGDLKATNHALRDATKMLLLLTGAVEQALPMFNTANGDPAPVRHVTDMLAEVHKIYNGHDR